jgi:hypothetical protein
MHFVGWDTHILRRPRSLRGSPEEVSMFAFRSVTCGRSALGAVTLATLALCVASCGGDSSTTGALPDASLGNHDSGFQSPPAEAGGDDATVGDETNGDDADAGSPGDASSGTDDSGDAAVGDGGVAEGDAGDGGTTVAEGGAGTDAGDAGIRDSGGEDSSSPGDAGPPDAGSVGTVPCGAATCTASSQVCCYGGGVNPACTAKNGCTGTAIDCRSTSNCQDGEICCLGVHGATAAATCTLSGSCTGVRLCADGDCAANETCTRGFCVPTGPGFDGGLPGFDGGFPGFDGGFLGFDGGFPLLP